MKTTQEFITIGDLVNLRRQDIAKPNHEYQRGVVWKRDQQMKLIDSVLRGYQLPIIYLHYKKRTVAGLTQESYDIIDGQQRLTALHDFVEGAFPLLAVDDEKARFPKFLHDEPCPWGEKDFHGLSEDLKQRLLNTELPVAKIETDNDNEVRDLFVRLQSGFPLNDQEKRDSYPGEFTSFVLSVGGKPQITRYPGHPFFQQVLRMKPGQDRGRTRRLAAQIAILFLERRRSGSDYFTDINARAIDDYYYANLDFDSDSDSCKRLRAILDKLNSLLGDGKVPKLRAHDAIHLVLLLDSIWDDYTRSWESNLQDAQGAFSEALAKAVQFSKQGVRDETWENYGVWTRSNSDRGENIRRRHRYYSQYMIKLLGNLTCKDPKRSFGPLEREIVYWRDKKTCQVCNAEVEWSEVEIHHKQPHSDGGRTELRNAALVHRGPCHQRGRLRSCGMLKAKALRGMMV